MPLSKTLAHVALDVSEDLAQWIAFSLRTQRPGFDSWHSRPKINRALLSQWAVAFDQTNLVQSKKESTNSIGACTKKLVQQKRTEYFS